MRHRSPNRYVSSQCFSVSTSRRWLREPPRYSHTRTASIYSVSAETRASECVVTMSWVRSLAATSSSATSPGVSRVARSSAQLSTRSRPERFITNAAARVTSESGTKRCNTTCMLLVTPGVQTQLPRS